MVSKQTLVYLVRKMKFLLALKALNAAAVCNISFKNKLSTFLKQKNLIIGKLLEEKLQIKSFL